MLNRNHVEWNGGHREGAQKSRKAIPYPLRNASDDDDYRFSCKDVKAKERQSTVVTYASKNMKYKSCENYSIQKSKIVKAVVDSQIKKSHCDMNIPQVPHATKAGQLSMRQWMVSWMIRDVC